MYVFSMRVFRIDMKLRKKKICEINCSEPFKICFNLGEELRICTAITYASHIEFVGY